MQIATIFATLKGSIALAQSFIQAGKDVAPILSAVAGFVGKGTKATQADVDALQAQNDAWSAELQAPLPAEED